MRKPLFILWMTLSGPLGGGAAQSHTPVFLNVATGEPGTTYSVMFKNLGVTCTDSAYLRERGTSGSLDNINLLLKNEVALAFVQSDVLKVKEQIENDDRVQNIRTLLPLFNEEVHLITRPVRVKKDLLGRVQSSGVASFQELANKKVAAWGGSSVTARVLSAKLNIPYQVMFYSNRSDAVRDFEAGKVDAMLVVMGQPSTWVEQLHDVQLLPIPYTAALKGIYTPAKMTYPTLGVNAMETVAVRSILVSRNFRTPAKRKMLLNYQQCAIKNLLRLQENDGMHPKWQEVDFKEWPWPKYN